MSTIKKGLGRGLSALIPESEMEMLRHVARGEATRNSKSVSSRSTAEGARQAAPKIVKVDKDKTILNSNKGAAEGENELHTPASIPINFIEPNPYQPRRFFKEEELADLANSIREHGVIQPIIVRPLREPSTSETPNGEIKYQLVAGERRWRASQAAGLQSVPAIVRAMDDQQALELALIENVQRHDISSVDAAMAYRRLASEFGLSQEDIARRVGKSRSAIANTLRLLDLSEEIRTALENGSISEGHGRAILLASGEGARRALYRRIVRDKLSVREVERLAKLSEDALSEESQQSPKGSIAEKTALSSDLQRIESALQKRLEARVFVRARARGGRIMIEYSSVEELQRIIKKLGTS